MSSQHSSHLDALCLLAALPLRKLHRAFPAAAADYFFVSLPRVALAAIVINALPFSRQVHVRQSLDLCRQLLANPGNILIIFPEGTRSRDGSDVVPVIGRALTCPHARRGSEPRRLWARRRSRRASAKLCSQNCRIFCRNL